ncbi:hypothetical protein Q3G72_011949 [Acer saccharum]|nr:hypothetical protein Q3G72_011949 [Acer saccharum]
MIICRLSIHRMRTSLMTLGVGTKNPSVNTTITPAIFDPDFFKKPNNRIYHIDELNDESILREWEKIRESLNTGISPRVLLSIVRVAMQIKTCDGSKNIMQLAPHQGLPDSLAATDLSESKIPIRAMRASRVRLVDEVGEERVDLGATVEETSKCKSMAIVASYLCCAILRLLKKSPSTFLKGIPSIIDTFADFYYTVDAETIYHFSMSEQMAHVIHSAFKNNIPLQRTVVFYLANAQDVLQPISQEYNLLKFILAQHIELKGLHAYKLYLQAFASVEGTLSNPVFMSWLMNDSSILPLKMIGHIIKNYDCETHRTNLFKYARYLDSGGRLFL